MTGLKVVKPGIYSLLQDHGRFGYQSQGITNGGSMDEYAARWANRLLGNSAQAPLIETTMGNLVLESDLHSVIAITGADQHFKINGKLRANWSIHIIGPGDQIQFGWPARGVRGYLAVAGGFNVSPEFGSVSTVVREQLGGLTGGPLMAGDYLPCEPSSQVAAISGVCEKISENGIPDYDQKIVVRVILGSQYPSFSSVDQNTFFNTEYQITAESDRMGIRLSGAPLNPVLKGILSEGVPFGAIQIPPDGQAIIMMKDRQTIGGYPKLGSILPLDAFRLSQLNTGRKIRFAPISLEQAQGLMAEFYQFFDT